MSAGLLPISRLPTFADLVSNAQLIVRVQVLNVKIADLRVGSQHIVTTSVTLSVLKILKGNSSSTLVLEMPGGNLSMVSVNLLGIPAFEKGDEDYLFIDPKAKSCPIVGRAYGRIRILKTGEGVAYVARDDRAPIGNVSDLVEPMQGAIWTPHESLLSPTDFEQAIQTELAHPSPRAPHPESEYFNLPTRHVKK